MFNVDREAALRVGAAIEAIHVYSLIHDDLPCMDDDDLRRGKPTVHRAFDEATAVLAGDSLHALAFEILANSGTHADPFIRAELMAALAKASGPEGMAGGQMMDLEAEKSEFDLPTVTLIGGGARSEYWRQMLADISGQQLDYRTGGDVGPALGAARLAQIAANPEKSLIELLPQLPLEQSHLPDAQRYAAYQPRRETFRRLYQQLLPLMA